MEVSSFEKLAVWKRGGRQALAIYSALKDTKDFGLKNQMERASVSVPSNIAEGAERKSTQEFIRFLNISLGSNAELRTQIYLAKELGIINDAQPLIKEAKEISACSKVLSALSKRNCKLFTAH